MRTVDITDQVSGDSATNVPVEDVAETITPWFPSAPAAVTEAIEGLQTALSRGEYTGEYEAYLAVRISR